MKKAYRTGALLTSFTTLLVSFAGCTANGPTDAYNNKAVSTSDMDNRTQGMPNRDRPGTSASSAPQAKQRTNAAQGTEHLDGT